MVRLHPRLPSFAALAQLAEALLSESRGSWFKSRARYHLPFAPVAQCRGGGFKLRSVPVRVRPGALHSHHHGTRTGQASRDSLLKRSCRPHARHEARDLRVPPFFQNQTLSSNRTGHPPFKRTTQGSNPARVANHHAHIAQQQRHDVESVASAGASPAVSTTVQSLDSEAAGF